MNDFIKAITSIIKLNPEQSLKLFIGSLISLILLFINERFLFVDFYISLNNILKIIMVISLIYSSTQLITSFIKIISKKISIKNTVKHLTKKEKKWIKTMIVQEKQNNNGMSEFSEEMISLRNKGIINSGELVAIGQLGNMTFQGAWAFNPEYWYYFNKNKRFLDIDKK